MVTQTEPCVFRGLSIPGLKWQCTLYNAWVNLHPGGVRFNSFAWNLWSVNLSTSCSITMTCQWVGLLKKKIFQCCQVIPHSAHFPESQITLNHCTRMQSGSHCSINNLEKWSFSHPSILSTGKSHICHAKVMQSVNLIMKNKVIVRATIKNERIKRASQHPLCKNTTDSLSYAPSALQWSKDSGVKWTYRNPDSKSRWNRFNWSHEHPQITIETKSLSKSNCFTVGTVAFKWLHAAFQTNSIGDSGPTTAPFSFNASLEKQSNSSRSL